MEVAARLVDRQEMVAHSQASAVWEVVHEQADLLVGQDETVRKEDQKEAGKWVQVGVKDEELEVVALEWVEVEVACT